MFVGGVGADEQDPLDDFADLETRRNDRFAAPDPEFAGFVGRTANGFGRFNESGDLASTRA